MAKTAKFISKHLKLSDSYDRNNIEHEIKQIFKIFDKDNRGYINKTQLKNLMRSFDLHVRDNEMDLLFEGVRTRNKEFIDLNEFIHLFRLIESEQPVVESDLKRTFALFDKQRSGFISINNLGCVLQKFGLNLSDKEIKEMIAEADQDKDELISYYDLMTALMRDEDTEDDSEDDSDEKEEDDSDEHEGEYYLKIFEEKSINDQLNSDIEEDDALEYNTTM